MLASSPVFAASFLITKALTRYERAGVIVVWQSISVTTVSLPLALLHWSRPDAMQWLLFVLCGAARQLPATTASRAPSAWPTSRPRSR